MDTTATLVRAYKARTGIESDYAMAKRLGITRQTASGYATGKHTLSNDVALKVAAELGLEPGYVLACMAAERAKRTEVREAWERVAKRMAHAAVFVMCLGLTYCLGWDLETAAHAVSFVVGYTHYAQSGAWLFAALLAARVCLKSRKRRP